VDLALQHLQAGDYGICETCRGDIGETQIKADPLSRYCLSCLTGDELNALQGDLERAWQVQGGMLPRQNLNVGSWEISYHYDPAGPVSGDYCDVVSLDRGELFFLLGDVAGKGIAASILMAHLRATLRSFITLNLPVNELLARANQVFCEINASAYYATLVCGRASRFGQVELCNAGHCPPLLITHGEVRNIAATGHPLGLFSDAEFAIERFQLTPGDSLLLYSDGLSEARNPLDEEYGAARLSRLVREHHALPSQPLIHACLRDLKTFQAGAPKSDDLTLMALSRVA
jgi:sigma-B regulation protein RsbU (phosphoserine phosphatase)